MNIKNTNLNINCRPQQISVPSYAIEQTVQPVTTVKTTTSTSNRNGTQYDPAYYNIYDDDSEIYKDVGKSVITFGGFFKLMFVFQIITKIEKSIGIMKYFF